VGAPEVAGDCRHLRLHVGGDLLRRPPAGGILPAEISHHVSDRRLASVHLSPASFAGVLQAGDEAGRVCDVASRPAPARPVEALELPRYRAVERPERMTGVGRVLAGPPTAHPIHLLELAQTVAGCVCVLTGPVAARFVETLEIARHLVVDRLQAAYGPRGMGLVRAMDGPHISGVSLLLGPDGRAQRSDLPLAREVSGHDLSA
jgi:hypothetical protein